MKRASGEGHFVNRRGNLFVPRIVLDRTSRVALHRQIAEEIARGIRGGPARLHDRLPSTRMLAKMLEVSRNTVLTAYEELVAEGLIAGEVGSGMRVKEASGPGVTLFGLQQVVREAHYPARVLRVEDLDGNGIYIRY